jgi:hypothetical protein
MGSGGPGRPPTGPDVDAERRCNAGGGSFLDIYGRGGSGVDCGTPGHSITGSKCGMTYYIYAHGHSAIQFSDGTSVEGLSGVRINGDDCSWEGFR